MQIKMEALQGLAIEDETLPAPEALFMDQSLPVVIEGAVQTWRQKSLYTPRSGNGTPIVFFPSSPTSTFHTSVYFSPFIHIHSLCCVD